MYEMIVHPPTFNSKHTPITTKIKISTLAEKSQENLSKAPDTFRWDTSSGEAFGKIVSSPESIEVINDIKCNLVTGKNKDDIDIAVNRFTNLLKSTAIKSLRLKKRTYNPKKDKKSHKWYDKDCTNLKRRIDNLAYLFAKNPKNPYISGQYIKCKKEYNKMIKQKKRIAEIIDINSLLNLTRCPSQFWKKIKRIKGNNKISLNLITPTEWYNYFSKLTNADNENVQEKYKRQHEIIQNELKDMLRDTKQNIITELDKPFIQKEIEEGIDKIKNNKASGNDSISNEMLKCTKKIISPLITELFNKIKLMAYYPELWEVGTITPFHKMDDIGDPDNYRGITINSCLSKLFTKIMNDRLIKYIEDNNLIKYNQIGFRKGFRTSDHVFVMKTLIDKYLSSGKRLYMCFIDFKKAYDTIWREGLFYKLLKQGMSKTFVRLLVNIYSRQKSCVNLGENVTKSFSTSTGLKQGCNLSPNLFNLFIEDITKCFSDSKCDTARLISENINCLLYADDLVLISETSEGLQNCLDNLHKYIKTWKLSINYTKTKSMILSKRKTKLKSIFKIGNEKIDSCSSYKYLGTKITENGSYKSNSVMLNKKAIGAMFTILKSVNKYYAGNVKILLELFDKMVVPIALYNSEVWGDILLPNNGRSENYLSESNIVNIVEKLQNRFLKYILGVNIKSTNWAVRSELGRTPLTMKAYERIITYYKHVHKSKSRLLQEALNIRTKRG